MKNIILTVICVSLLFLTWMTGHYYCLQYNITKSHANALLKADRQLRAVLYRKKALPGFIAINKKYLKTMIKNLPAMHGANKELTIAMINYRAAQLNFLEEKK